MNSIKLYISLLIMFLTFPLHSQNNIYENPFQLNWVNQQIDNYPNDGNSSIQFSIGTNVGETIIQVSELENSLTLQIKSFDKNEALLQSCINNNGNWECSPTLDQIVLENQKIFWAAGESFDCRLSDSLELLRFYWTMNGPEWEKTWDLSHAKTTWENIDFHNNGCVKSVKADKNAQGEILDYHFLENEVLDFRLTPGVTGILPNFQHMPKLELLYILGTQVTGSIPNFNNIPELTLMTLTQSEFNGTIPNFDHLPNITNISLSSNNLTGNIPELDKCLKLKRLAVGQNELDGPIPHFDNHPDLFQLNAPANNLTGEIPSFDQNSNLNFINIPSNQLTGEIPKFHNCPLLRDIHIQRNLLTGNIPELDSCIQLKSLKVDGNKLTGDIPSFENSPLETLICRDNFLTGIVPDFSKSCPTLYLCDITFNSFTFEHLLPHYIANDTSLISPFPQFVMGDYTHDPQNRIYPDTIFYKNIGESLVIDLMIDDTVTNNTYRWFKNDTIFKEIIGDNTIEFNNLQESDSGSYTVEITNPLVPELTLDSYQIILEVKETSSFESTLDININIYPNPIQDQLTIERPQHTYIGDTKVTIRDLKGQAIFQKNIFQNQKNIQIDCSGILPGLYFIIYQDGEYRCGKYIVKI